MALDLIAEFESVLDALSGARIEYAVCGGMAVNIYGHVRATRDIDLLIRPEALDLVKATLATRGYVLEAGPIPFGAGTPVERRLHRVSKVEGASLLTLDLLLVTPVFERVWSRRTRAGWRGRDLWVVSLDGLGIMKRLAGRPQDLADLEQLGVGPEHDDDA
jgi:hypothetical protein